MKILKESGNFLKRKARRNLILIVFCLIGFAGILCSMVRFSPLYINVYEYEGPRSLLLALFLIPGMHFFRGYKNYKDGFEGENQVTKSLYSALNDQYYLINDVKFSGRYGNIDHVVLAPNGIFVIETKNHRGKITCYGDNWYGLKGGSPSKQVRGNA